MSWIKKSLSCFHYDKKNRCECNKKNDLKSYDNGDALTKSEIFHKNTQCNFDDEFNEEHLLCDKGQ